MTTIQSYLDRFNTKYRVTSTGCWQWTDSLSPSGYGNFHAPKDGRNSWRAHRWGYEAFVGPIPEGLVLDHLCRNRGCVNPAHLEPVTQLENIRRGISPFVRTERWAEFKPWDYANECKYGHTREGKTVVDSRGLKDCILCRRKRNVRATQRARARAKKTPAS